jgi:hypothetical protein
MKSKKAQNILVMVVAVLIGYGLLDVFVFRNLLMHMPLHLHSELGRLKFLAQSSKSNIVPKDYILVLGDSYAEGLGDWRLSIDENANPKFTSGHVLHDLSGRDVLGFGVRGGHPSFAYVTNMTRSFSGLNLYWGLEVEPPKDIVAFFFEGNDVNDEMFSLGYHYKNSGRDINRLYDEEYYRTYINELGDLGTQKSLSRWHFLRNALLFDTMTKLVKFNYRLYQRDQLFNSRRVYRAASLQAKNTANAVLIRGQSTPYPDATVEPFAFHSADQIKKAGYVFKHSLAYTKSYFPKAKIWLVYIPAVATSYDHAKGKVVLRDRIRFVDTEKPGPRKSFTNAEIRGQSNKICNVIYEQSQELGVNFIDTRSAIRKAAGEIGPLHGPNDWGHFNKKGYTVLAEMIYRNMQGFKDRGCRLN